MRIVCLVASLVAACSSSSSPAPLDASTANVITVREAAAYGTGSARPAILRDVFVTAVSTIGFWVADDLVATAGDGIFVILTTPVPSSIVVGASVTVTGIDEQAGAYLGKPSIAQLAQANLVGTPVAPGGSPTPLALDANDAALATTNPAAFDGAPWGGVLVALPGPFAVASAPNAQNQITLAGTFGTVVMDDGAFPNYAGGTFFAPDGGDIDGGLTNDAGVPAVGTCFTALVGVMDLDSEAQLRTVNPRSSADIPASAYCP